jgi:crossover junction endodeoxyribonuclease RusA
VIIDAFVPGDPKPQGSKRGFVTKTGRVAMVEMAGTPLKRWRESITWVMRGEAAKKGWEVTDAPVNVKLVFELKKPKKPKTHVPITRPDVDKLVRAVLDAITDTGLIWRDDSQVVRLSAEKKYARAGKQGVTIMLWKTQ